MAAAIGSAGADAVAPLAHATLAHSDNFAAGRVIDLIGIDAVNAWTHETAGLTDTHLACWNYGRRRLSASARSGSGCGNVTTMADLAMFHARLRRGELLEPSDSATLIGWLEDTPRGSDTSISTAGALPARLPATVAAGSAHKAGWLPPGCCRNDHRLIIDAGVIPLPDGDWFAIAAIADRGSNYGLSVRWVGYAACRVHRLLSQVATRPCTRAGDKA